MRLNRKQKTVRNLLVAALCLTLTWVWAGCPPLTRGMMLRQAARANLVSGWEEVYDESWPDQGRVMYLRWGEDYWQLRYKGLEVLQTDICGTGGVMVTPSRETAGDLLVATSLDAVSAEVTWNIRGQEMTWTVAGELLGDGLFRFPAPEGLSEENRRILQGSAWPERVLDYTLRLYSETGDLLREVSG